VYRKKPRLRLDLFPGDWRLRRVFPFRRSWIAILIIGAAAVGMAIPAVMSIRQAAEEWKSLDTLFDLVGVVFLGGWALGWSIAPLILTLIFSMLLFGREVLRVRRGVVEVLIGLPGIGLAFEYDATRMRNLRHETPPPKSGLSWRGPYVAFDYDGRTENFGSTIAESQLSELRHALQTAAGTVIRNSTIRDQQPGQAKLSQLRNLMQSVAEKAARNRADVTQQSAGNAPPHKSAGSSMSLSIAVLVAANLVPVYGAVAWNWDLGYVLLLYWAESAVIGFFNLCKMAVVHKWLVLFTGPFFLGHFGGFMSIHFLFLYTIFLKGLEPGSGVSGGELAQVFHLFRDLWPALVALFLSHGVSFFSNFIGRREYLGRSMRDQMMEPYSRIIFMHLVIIFGGMLTMVLGDRTPVLLAVIGLKVLMDIRAHIKERQAQERRLGTGLPAAR